MILQLEIPLDTVCYAAKLAKSLGKTVILDPAPVPEHFPEELYEYVDIVKPNETELGMLTGIAEAQKHLTEAAQVLKARGVKNVLVTLGGDGVYINPESGEEIRIPACKVKAVDTTAAGDSFTAALAAMLLNGESLEAAAEFANRVSAIVVTRKGAQSSIPTIDEVKLQQRTGKGLDNTYENWIYRSWHYGSSYGKRICYWQVQRLLFLI